MLRNIERVLIFWDRLNHKKEKIKQGAKIEEIQTIRKCHSSTKTKKENE